MGAEGVAVLGDRADRGLERAQPQDDVTADSDRVSAVEVTTRDREAEDRGARHGRGDLWHGVDLVRHAREEFVGVSLGDEAVADVLREGMHEDDSRCASLLLHDGGVGGGSLGTSDRRWGGGDKLGREAFDDG